MDSKVKTIEQLQGENFERILDRLLNAFPEEYDKREGSIAWDIFAPFAVEERLIFLQILWIWKNMFADTADRPALKRLAKMRNVEALSATKAVVEGKFNREIPIGARFNYEAINYTATEALASKEDGFFFYALRCETAGKVGNAYDVDITPIENIDQLTFSRITRTLIPGEEEEETEALRERYYESIRQRDYGFNISQYVHETERIPGVGYVRCYPATPEKGHVTLYITDSDGMPPTQELVDKVQEILDPKTEHQMGVGLAPIGHYVHVQGAKKDMINITLHVTAHEGLSDGLKIEIQKRIEQYLSSIRKEYSKTYSGTHPILDRRLVVRESFIETQVLSVNTLANGKIIDVSVQTINGQKGNYELADNSLPILGEITYEEV